MPRTILPPLLALLALCACAARQASDSTAAPATRAGTDSTFAVAARAAAGQLKSGLMRELTGAMRDGGPVAAVDVCRTRAAQIADEVSSATGLSVGRVSTRNRNPENAAGAAHLAVLAAFEANPDLADTVIHVDGAPVYLGAIRIGARACLGCHGPRAELDPALLDILDTHYPDDRATGFALGDLRGAFVVR